MSPLSTAEVAALIGVHRVTLEEWLRKKKVRGPRTVPIGRKTYRIWTDRDIERLREYKARFYRKGRGRKKRSEVMP